MNRPDALAYAAPILSVLFLALVVIWVLRGPRDFVIDFHYLPETLRSAGGAAHQPHLRSRFC